MDPIKPIRWSPVRAAPDPGTIPAIPAAIWCDAGAVSVPALLDLLRLLIAECPGLRVVLTSGPGIDLPDRLPDGVSGSVRPADAREAAAQFLDEHRPAMALFAGSEIHAAAASLCHDRHIPVVVIEGRMRDRAGLARLWNLRGRGRLRLADRILAASPVDAEHFARMGIDPTQIEMGGELEPVALPLPCDEDERLALTQIIKTRPVWLAAGTGADEVPRIHEAMRRASRLSHRLLLIAAPMRPADGPGLATQFAAAGWRTALRSAGDDPGDEVQVYVADCEDELGLWYRLSPVTFLGGSLTPEGTRIDPFDPARLGSAVIRGDGPSLHAAAARRLSQTRASRTVRSAEELAEALLELLSPERAALLARRAWDETSRGADLHNRVLELVGAAIRPAAP